MPHLEIRYSSDINLDTSLLFDEIETSIQEFDSSAGVCKSRSYPAEIYKHSHIMIDLWLLPKPHRDAAFNQELLKRLENCVKQQISRDCYISVQLHYRDVNYITIE